MKIENIEINKIIPYSLNNRKHPEKQINHLANSIKEFGFLVPILIDKDNVLIAGHGRLEAAKKLGLKEVPSITADNLTDAQIKAYRILDNKLTLDSEWDLSNLEVELSALKDLDFNFNDFGLDDLNTLKVELEDIDGNLTEGESSIEIYNYNENIIFPSENLYNIPELLPNKCFNELPLKTFNSFAKEITKDELIVFRSCSISFAKNNFLAFYIDDYRFNTIWDKAIDFLSQIKIINPKCLLSPDFSLWSDYPDAINIYNIYRNRWVARYWQEAGFNIIPSLSWSNKKSLEYCFLGIPKESPIVSIQARTIGKSKKSLDNFYNGLAYGVDTIKPNKIMVYSSESLFSSLIKQGIKGDFVFYQTWQSYRDKK